MASIRVFALFLTFSMLLTGVSRADDGPSVDNDGIITWGDLPQPSEYETKQVDYDAYGMIWIYNPAKWFASLMTKELDTDFILKWAEKDGLSDDDIGDLVTESLLQVMGLLICISIGIVFLILMPIVGCCFCCGRLCCGCCGGNGKQSKSSAEGCGRGCLSITVFMLAGLLLSGTICLLVADVRMLDTIDETERFVDTNFDDVNTFLNSTMAQVEYVGETELSFTVGEINKDLEEIDEQLGEVIVTQIDDVAGLTESMDEVEKLDKDINTLLDESVDMRETLSLLNDNLTDLEEDLENLKSNLTTVCVNLTEPSVCDTLEIDALKVTLDVKEVLQGFTDFTILLAGIAEANLSGLVQEVKDEIDYIPKEIYNATSDVRQDIKTSLDDIEEDVSHTLTDMRKEVDNFTTDVKQLKQNVSESLNSEERELAELLWVWGWVALSLIPLAISSLLFCGLCCGVFGSGKQVVPTERSSASNCGGNSLLCAVISCYVFFSLLILLCIMFFAIGVPTEQYGCKPLMDPNLTDIAKLIDEPGTPLIPELEDDEYLFSSLLFDDASIPLKFTGALKDCRNNTAIYEALKLENVYDVEELTENLTDLVDKDEILNLIESTVDLANVKIVTDKVNATMDSLIGGLEDLNVEMKNYLNELNTDITSKDLLKFASEIDDLANQTDSDELADLADETREIHETYIANITSLQSLAIGQLKAIDAMVADLQNSTNDTYDSLTKTENEIQSQGDRIVTEASDEYISRVIRYADQYASRIVDVLTKEAGLCEPVWTAYAASVSIVCETFMNPFQGIWWCLGWICFIMFLTVIFATMLVKHYKRMNYSDGYDTRFLPQENPSYGSTAQLLSNPAKLQEDEHRAGNQYELDNVTPPPRYSSKVPPGYMPGYMDPGKPRPVYTIPPNQCYPSLPTHDYSDSTADYPRQRDDGWSGGEPRGAEGATKTRNDSMEFVDHIYENNDFTNCKKPVNAVRVLPEPDYNDMYYQKKLPDPKNDDYYFYFN